MYELVCGFIIGSILLVLGATYIPSKAYRLYGFISLYLGILITSISSLGIIGYWVVKLVTKWIGA
ncbi:hypothetical protein [Proteus phage RP7]|nr:hypothetical protein [Proteus phage RP7]